ncbi:MAG TPA: TrmJ/YjtD family RNA methyltransferase [Spirochaetota bacterium]|nr:TrmJ/YjtD family RNA methyltransferase [Spirochaetota bacterium]
MHITFVLVEPAVPENIGAAARALVTCGFGDLVLVNPSGHEDERARWLAVGSEEVLAGARVCATLAEAVKGADLVVGTTARHRAFPRPLVDSRDLPLFLKEKNDPAMRVALVFGSEQNGLSNEQLALCHVVTTVPLAAAYPSLNLAQAVMVYAYELSRATLAAPPVDAPPVEPVKLGVFLEHTQEVLVRAGIKPEENVWRRILEHVAHFHAYEVGAFHVLWGRLLGKTKD